MNSGRGVAFVRYAMPVVLLASLAACGGGGGAGPTDAPGRGGFVPPPPSSTPVPTVPQTQTMSVSFGTSGTTATFPAIASGASGSITFPAASQGSAVGMLTLQSTLPAGAPVPQSRYIRGLTQRDSLGGNVNAIAYISMTVNSNVSFGATPTFSMNFPAGTLSGYAYVAFYNPANANAGWTSILGPVKASGTTLAFTPGAPISPALALTPNSTYTYAIVETGTPLPTPTPDATATPVPTPTPKATAKPTPTPVPTATPMRGTASPLPSVSAPYGWSPSSVANALKFPVQSGFNGAGQTVAVIIDAAPSMSDVQTYLSDFKIPSTGRTIRVQNVDGGPSNPDSSSTTEATLDVETVAGLAPGANVAVYAVPGLTFQATTDALNEIVSNHAASVISYSAGGCEYDGVSNDAVYQQAASSGIAVIASSGDQGNECFTGGTPQYRVGVDYPGSDPNVVDLGGTETNPPAYGLTSTTVWNDDSCGSGVACAGGGGVSQYFSLPSYQQSLTGESSTQYRNTPDVSMPAEADPIIYNGAWQFMDGTSWGAPQYAALMAEVYQYCNTIFQNASALPYYAASANPSAFIDVVSGNDQYGGGTPFYSAGRGYDDASGLGVPLGMPFANTICPNRVPAAALAGTAHTASAVSVRSDGGSRSIGIAPHLDGMRDLGRRQANARTRVQLVLHPSATLANDEQTVVNALQQAGFTIEQRFANHLVIDAEGSNAAVERFFSTRLHAFAQPNHGTRYAPVTQAVIPASIAPYVAQLSLDDIVTMHTVR